MINKYFFRHKRNELHVINDTSLSLPDKGLITILGESGSGKTTLLNVIGGLDGYDSGELIIDLKEAYKFKTNFPKGDSRGISKMEIFCYDLMLLEKNSKEKNIDFLIHDSELFSDVDSRQVAKAIQLAETKCTKHNLQYIFTMNSDELAITLLKIETALLLRIKYLLSFLYCSLGGNLGSNSFGATSFINIQNP